MVGISSHHVSKRGSCCLFDYLNWTHTKLPHTWELTPPFNTTWYCVVDHVMSRLFFFVVVVVLQFWKQIISRKYEIVFMHTIHMKTIKTNFQLSDLHWQNIHKRAHLYWELIFSCCHCNFEIEILEISAECKTFDRTDGEYRCLADLSVIRWWFNSRFPYKASTKTVAYLGVLAGCQINRKFIIRKCHK